MKVHVSMLRWSTVIVNMTGKVIKGRAIFHLVLMDSSIFQWHFHLNKTRRGKKKVGNGAESFLRLILSYTKGLINKLRGRGETGGSFHPTPKCRWESLTFIPVSGFVATANVSLRRSIIKSQSARLDNLGGQHYNYLPAEFSLVILLCGGRCVAPDLSGVA